MKRVFNLIIGLAVALSAMQAQNSVTVGNVELKAGETAVISVELTNETAFSAFQVDLKLPEGFSVATMINEDEEEVLDITLNANRKKSTHQLAYNVLSDGAIRIASYSSTNATYKGTSGEIVRIRIVATDEITAGDYNAELSKMLFSTSEPVAEYDLGSVNFQIAYSKDDEVIIPNRTIEVHAGQYGRCLLEGRVVEPNEAYTLSGALENGTVLKLYFVPFDGYTANSMKRNGEVVAIQNNVYEETIAEDVVFTDVNYKQIVDTVIVPEIIVDTVFIEKTDTIFIPEIEELPIPVITCDSGLVTITCEESDVTILYAINGDPLEGDIYENPFEIAENAVVSAVAVKSGEKAELAIITSGIAQPQMRIVTRRYYNEDGVEMISPENGVTIVVTEYEDGSKRVYKIVKNDSLR